MLPCPTGVALLKSGRSTFMNGKAGTMPGNHGSREVRDCFLRGAPGTSPADEFSGISRPEITGLTSGALPILLRILTSYRIVFAPGLEPERGPRARGSQGYHCYALPRWRAD